MDDSSCLSAIQSLSGRTPNEKFKYLHGIVTEMVKSKEECENFLNTGVTTRVHPGLIPYLQILVGESMQSNDAIIAAMKSDDVTIIKRALSSKFFFDINNPLLNPEYFISNIIPYISLRTRRELIKTLARHLARNPQLADSFFSKFSTVLGFQQAFPLIIACSENYIETSIFSRPDIILPSRILRILYRKYPQLIIRQFKSSKQWRKDYINFLPELIKRYTNEFVLIYEKLSETDNTLGYVNLNLGSTRAKSFLKNASETIVEKPQTFFNLVPLKLVTYKLGIEKFEKMLKNLMSKKFDFENPNFTEMALLLKYYYPEKNRLPFIKEMCELYYKKNVFDLENILDKPEFYQLVTDSSLKKEIGQKLISAFVNKSEQDDHIYYLPPEESIPKLKEMIKTPEKSRYHWINQMIYSCVIYDDKARLLDVLKYYNARHKNERWSVLENVLQNLTQKLDFKANSLSESHYNEIKVMVQTAYLKGDLFSFSSYLYESIVQKLLIFYAYGDYTEEIELLEAIIMEGYLEHNKKWNLSDLFEKIDKESATLANRSNVLEKFLIIMDKNYSNDHVVWNMFSNKLSISYQLVKAVQNQKMKNLHKSSESWILGQTKLSQLKSFAKELVEMDLTNLSRFDKRQLKNFRDLVLKYDPISYQKWIDDNPAQINDIESHDALILLRKDHTKIHDKCIQYLDQSRKSLLSGNKFARQFVAATKWYENIPIQFVNQCFKEIETEGSIFVLGILLEGSKFKDIAETYLPEDKVLNVKDDSSKKNYQSIKCLSKALNLTNPPVPLAVIIPFCQGDYISLIRQTLINVGHRTPLNEVFKFVDQLVEKPVAVRKVGFQLVFEVAMKNKLQGFLVERWKKESNRSIREVMVKMIFDLFKQTPNEENWQLVLSSIDGLTVDDAKILDRMIDVRTIDETYFPQYVQKLVAKINSFEDNELDKSKLISSLIKNIDENIKKLPDDLIDSIVNKYMFNLNIYFVLYKYLSSDNDKFEHRLMKFLEILRCVAENYNKPDEKIPRFYRAKYMLEDFVQKLMSALVQKNHEASFKIVQQILALFESRFQPYEFPHIYVQLNLLKVFFESEIEMSPREFGVNCGKKFPEIMKQISAESFLNFISTSLYQFLALKNNRKANERLDLIEGLMESDDYYGSLVGIHIISQHYFLDDFDDRYDRFMNTWRESKNPTILTVLNECSKSNNDWYGQCKAGLR